MFSLRAMLVAVAVAAICAAGFVHQTKLWADIVVSLALALFAYGLISIYLFPSKRSFFVPAIIVGVVYGAAVYWEKDSLISNRLIVTWWRSQTKQGADFLTIPHLSRDDNALDTILFSDEGIDRFGGEPWHVNSLRSLQQIGHSAIAILLSVVTGVVCSYVARKRQVNPSEANR